MAAPLVTEDPRRTTPVLALPTREAVKLVAELRASWDSACRGRYHDTLTVVVAGRTVCIDAVDRALFDMLTPALAHMRVDDVASPDLTIRLWSLHHGDVRRPRLPAVLVQHGEVTSVDDDQHVRARFDHPNHAVMAWSSPAREAWWCIKSIDDVQWWEEAAPFRPIWSWFLPAHDAHLAHCAAIGDADGAIMLVGVGGSGKSTTALSCFLAGSGYVGDDYCVITIDPIPMVHSLFGTAKLRIDVGVERGPLAGHLLRPTPPPGGKAVALMSALDGAHIVVRAPVAAVAAVSVGTSRTTEVLDASRPDVLSALAPSSLSQLPGAGRESLSAFISLVRTVPTCRIVLGHDRAGVVAAVRSLIADPTYRTGSDDHR